MMSNSKFAVVITMPCFNESEGIEEFIFELCESLGSKLKKLIVVNDSSTDSTSEVVNSIMLYDSRVILMNNPTNLGHGPSTLIGMKCALESSFDTVVTLDGDGQFIATEVDAALDFFYNSKVNLLEGARISRKDPWFRKIVTQSLRLIVTLSSNKLPKDANTPFRIYQKDVLSSLFTQLDSMSMTPNLEISIKARQMNLQIAEYEVTSRERKGKEKIGVTWNSKNSFIPSKRFVTFCGQAFFRLFRKESN